MEGEEPVILFKNTYTMERVKVSVVKVWDDNDNVDNLRPATLTVELKADGESIPSGEADKTTVTLTMDDLWAKKSIENLPKYKYTLNEDGVALSRTEIKYSWTELDLPEGYQLSDSSEDVDPENAEITTTLTNRHEQNKVSVFVEKIWADADNADKIRPASIKVQLKADGVAEGDPVVLDESNEWKHTWLDLPENKDEGTAIQYTVDEVEVPFDYKKEITGDMKVGFKITNTHEPEYVKVSGIKTWADAEDDDKIRPDSVTVILKADGTEIDKTTATKAGNWAWKFENLPKYKFTYDKDGFATGKTEIKYEVDESAVPEYDPPEITKDPTTGEITIKNPHTPEKVTATVKKVWVDAENQSSTRPESLVVELQADGKSMDPKKVVTLTAENSWTQTIENLPKYKFDVKTDGDVRTVTKTEIKYSWVEVDVPAGYVLSGTSTEGTITTITNTLVTGDLAITKRVDGPVDPVYRGTEFTVQITLTKDGKPVNGSFTSTVSSGSASTTRTVTFTDGVAWIGILNGETVTIHGLPEGAQYTVDEVNLDACWRLVSIDHPTGTIGASATVSVTLVNQFQTGSLLIKKTVTGNRGNKQREFPFRVWFWDEDGNELEGQQFPYYSNVEGKSGYIVSGGTIYLKHGEYVIIEGIPVGTRYQVTETNSYGHHVTSTGEVGTITLVRAEASFVNYRSDVPKTGETNLLPVTIPAMGVSGLGMILSALLGKKKRKSRKEDE